MTALKEKGILETYQDYVTEEKYEHLRLNQDDGIEGKRNN